MNTQDSLKMQKDDVKPLLVSSRPDGLGIRLLDMIIGMYLARKMEIPFVFTWENSLDISVLNNVQGLNKTQGTEYISPSIESAEFMFDTVFLAKYLKSADDFGISYGGNIAKARVKDIDSLKKLPWDMSLGYYSCTYLPCDIVEDLEREEVFCDLKKAYEEILFSEGFEEIKQYARLKASELGDFIAIHLRSGEMIYGASKHYIMFIAGRHFPHEVAIEIITQALKQNKKVVIFGQDIQADESLARYFESVGGGVILHIVCKRSMDILG